MREMFKPFYNKIVSITKELDGYVYYYHGRICKVFNGGFIIDDRKLGKIPLGFEGVSILRVEK